MSITDGPVWLSPAALAALLREGGSRTHLNTVHKACASAELHSHQRRPNGRRYIALAAANAWIRGGSEAAQIVACGCRPLAVVRRSA